MDTKITRRVVLGTIIGGLAVGPFVMRALRPQRQLGESRDPSQRQRDAEIAIISEKSGISVEKVRDVLAIFEAERTRWTKFRGFKANINLTLQGQSRDSDGWRSFAEDGVITLKISESQTATVSMTHWDYDMVYYEPNGSNKRWSFFSKAVQRDHPEFSGSRSIVNNPNELLENLLAPFNFFTVPWANPENVITLLGLGHWTILLDGEKKNPTSDFTFKHQFTRGLGEKAFPDVCFKSCRFSSITENLRENVTEKVQIDHFDSNGNFPFPTYFVSQIHNALEEGKWTKTAKLSNLILYTV